MKKLLFIFIAISLTFSAHAKTTPQEIIIQINNKSLALYDQLKEKYAQNTDPLIIVWSTKLSFYHNNILREYPIVTDEYIDIKSISHVTLATFALFNPVNKFPENMVLAKDYQTQVKKTLDIVDALPLNNTQKIRQKIILNKTYNFLQHAITKKAASPTELNLFMAELSPFILKGMDESANSLLILLNQQMAKIQHQLTPAEKNKLFVVLPGLKAPRPENILAQYFAKYLNEPIDSKRFIYAEGLLDNKSILTLVGGWQLEPFISGAFFRQPNRMRQDILANSAQRYLQQCHIDKTGEQALICPHRSLN